MLISVEQQRGVTLIELMIATAIALITLASIVVVYSSTASHSSQQLQQAHLHQQSHAILQLIHNDLKRSGYWAFDPSQSYPENNPFQTPLQRIRVAAYSQERAGSCILFSYDLDRDGLVGIGQCGNSTCPNGFDMDNVEQYGYRLRSGRIESRQGGRDFNCDSGYWQSINESDIEITHLNFSLASNCTNLKPSVASCTHRSNRIVKHAIEISLHVRHTNNPASLLSLEDFIRIRNNQILVGR